MKKITGTKLTVSALSDIGKVRKINEDNFALAEAKNGTLIESFFHGEIDDAGFLMFVCDGSGGDGRGKVASDMAIEIFQKELFQCDTKLSIGERLIQAATNTNEAIWIESNEDNRLKGMAATITAAWLVPPLVYILEVGDSRCYLVRDNTIRQVTRDQSMVQALIDSGVLTLKDAATHPYRNVVLQSLGAQVTLTPVVTWLELAHGDRLLLCSDGLSKNLPEENMLRIFKKNRAAEDACRALIDAANDLEADDNITAIVALVYGKQLTLAKELSRPIVSEAVDEYTPLSETLIDVTDMLAPAESEDGEL